MYNTRYLIGYNNTSADSTCLVTEYSTEQELARFYTGGQSEKYYCLNAINNGIKVIVVSGTNQDECFNTIEKIVNKKNKEFVLNPELGILPIALTDFGSTDKQLQRRLYDLANKTETLYIISTC